MEEFDFSVEISDQDWQCFYTQCEECNVLPPAIAALEDSGMSDMDDLGAFFGKRLQKCEIETYQSEETVADGPPVCEGSPQELYLEKHHSGGVESVLSDSDEDIHLQSVNMFFEHMKILADSQRSSLQDQVGVIKNNPLTEELRRNGQSANSTDYASPKNIPLLNSPRGVAAGIKTAECVSTVRNKYSLLTDESSSESSASIYVKHPYLKTKLYIDSSSENTESENAKHRYLPSKPPNLTAFSNKVPPTDRKDVYIYDVKDESIQQKNSVANDKKTEDKSTQVSPSESETVTYKLVSKESSPRASVKRKRRKKRRLSVEPENLFRRDRLYSSEDELFTWRRAIDPCFSKDFRWSGLKHQQPKCDFMPPLGHCKLSCSLPAGVEADEIRMDFPLLSAQRHWQNESIYIQDNFGPTNFEKCHSTKSDSKERTISQIPNGDNMNEQELTKVKENLTFTEFQPENVPSSSNNYRNEVKSIPNAIFQSAESDDPRVAIGRSVNVPSTKSVMHEDFETEKVSLCPITCQSHHMVENMTPSQCETAMSISTVTELLDHTTRHHVSQSADMVEACATLPNPDLIMNGTMQTEKDSKKEDSAPKQEITVSEDCTAQDKNEENQIVNGTMFQSELHPHSESKNQLQPSSLSSLLSRPSLETKPIVPLSDVNITHSPENSAVSRNYPNVQDKHKQVTAKHEKIDSILLNEFSQLSHDPMEEPCWDRVEVVMTNSESDELTEPGVKPRHTVFAMSSFWKEMEKLTINDILGSRKENTTQSSFLPSLRETDDTDLLTLSDLGCCSLAEERKSAIPDPVDCNLSSTMTSDSSMRGVLWESDPVPMSLLSKKNFKDTTTVNDYVEPIATPVRQGGLKRISKKVSVQNLCAVGSDSFCNTIYCQSAIKPPEEDTCNDTGYFPEDPAPERDLRPPSMIENFKLSLTDIYSYFFNEKQADTNLEWPTENIVQPYIEGDSEPENYDHFYSEFGTDSYTDKDKPELVPIFSCSRSSQSKMEFHDSYDLFLVSSSDDSHSESDEEEEQERPPIRVVTRFTRSASSKDIVTDAYEHFYTDRDLQQDFFKTTFSFRNVKLTDNNVHKQTSTSALTLDSPKHQMRSFHIKALPITVLGNQEILFPDSIVRSFDDQVITRLQQPLIYQSLRTAVANPNLDAPLLPLKQSDMCLICIAFASWVLKTADPRAGDAWKAVLLANVSALSAIRYLRRYFKGDNTAGAKKLHLKSPCLS